MQDLIVEIIRRLDLLSSCERLTGLYPYLSGVWVVKLASFFMLVSVLGLVGGVAVLLYPALVWNASRLFFRFGDWMEAPLNRTIRVERWFYRHNRFTGITICLLSLYALVYYFFVYNRVFTYYYFSFFYHPMMVDWVLASLEFLFVVFFLVALVFGAVVFYRPSLIKRIETICNTWVVPASELEREIPAPLYPSRWLGLRVTLVHLSLLTLFTLWLFTTC